MAVTAMEVTPELEMELEVMVMPSPAASFEAKDGASVISYRKLRALVTLRLFTVRPAKVGVDVE